jgi:hypothetical protein
MKDFLENELSVGDKVVFTPPDYKNFCLGTIVKIAAKQIAIEYINTRNYGKNNTKTDIKYEYPDRVVKKIEVHSYQQSVAMVTHVRKNYESIIARKEREIARLKRKIK